MTEPESRSMFLDDAIAQLAKASDDLPREAMGWCLDHWDEASPRFLDMLDRYAEGGERSKDTANVLFFAIYLMAQLSEVRAFAPLCRLARDHDAIDTVLGDGITETLKHLLISTYDGESGTLKGLIANPDVDEFVRCAAFDAFAYLVAAGQIDRNEAESWLAGLFEALQAEDSSTWAWTGWVTTIALLGLESLTPLVKKAFEKELIDPSWASFVHFEEMMKRTLDDPERMAGFIYENIHPFGNAVEELSSWHCFTEQRKIDERKRQERERKAQSRPVAMSARPKPHRSTGRNDPCPCGSGKKFKKCCLQ
ncbi:MAG: DUF1186 domain-containing protein [Planctomycetota bacterium]